MRRGHPRAGSQPLSDRAENCVLYDDGCETGLSDFDPGSAAGAVCGGLIEGGILGSARGSGPASTEHSVTTPPEFLKIEQPESGKPGSIQIGLQSGYNLQRLPHQARRTIGGD
jgi:hypothetical protein